MIGRAGNLLGAAMSDRSIAFAEISTSGDRRSVRRVATFEYPAGVSLETPEAAGQAAAAFLKQKNFTGQRVVVGVPARWLIAVEKEVPPADETAARATLRLQAEGLAVAESGEVIFDFAGESNANTAVKVLLVGVLRQRIQQIEKLIAAAGLSTAAITSTGLTLASCTRGEGKSEGGMLLLASNGGEMVWRTSGSPRMLRHVPLTVNGHAGAPFAALGAELRRAMTLAQPNGDDASRGLLLVDGLGLKPADVAELSDRLGVRVRSTDGLQPLGIDGSPSGGGEPIGQFAPALSLALAGARPELLPLDFNNSRLMPVVRRRIGRRGGWIIALAATALIALVATLISVSQQQSELDDLTQRLTTLKPDIDQAQGVIDRLKYGRMFFDTRPPMLDCLRDVTLALHDDEKLWVTSISLRDTGKGTIVGRSLDQKAVLGLVDRLNGNKHFVEAKMMDMHEADARSHEIAFMISFTFNRVE